MLCRLESKLADIVINLKATLDEIKTHTAREKFKAQVLGCLRAWREWNVYSPDYLAQLDIVFAGGKSNEVTTFTFSLQSSWGTPAL